jgi:hypothetical protein
MSKDSSDGGDYDYIIDSEADVTENANNNPFGVSR